MDHQPSPQQGESPDPDAGPVSDGPRRLEVASRTLVGRRIDDCALLLDSREIGEFEWVRGQYPELHLDAEDLSGFVGLNRLRPLVLSGFSQGAGSDPVQILHSGSAGWGLVEVGGVQFLRQTFLSGKQEVRASDGSTVLSSGKPSGNRFRTYRSRSSNLTTPHLLELTLVEVFLAFFQGEYMLRAMFSGFIRRPELGTPLLALPKVAAAVRGSAPLTAPAAGSSGESLRPFRRRE